MSVGLTVPMLRHPAADSTQVAPRGPGFLRSLPPPLIRLAGSLRRLACAALASRSATVGL